MWENEKIDLGRLKERESKLVEFKYEGKLDIIKITTSCSCTAGTYDTKTNILSATFKAGDVPVHLEYKGEVVVNQRIRVESLQGEFLLEFTAIIEK